MLSVQDMNLDVISPLMVKNTNSLHVIKKTSFIDGYKESMPLSGLQNHSAANVSHEIVPQFCQQKPLSSYIIYAVFYYFEGHHLGGSFREIKQKKNQVDPGLLPYSFKNNGAEASPARDHLWRQIFFSKKKSHLIFSDVSFYALSKKRGGIALLLSICRSVHQKFPFIFFPKVSLTEMRFCVQICHPNI